MRFELSVVSEAAGVDVTVASDIADDLIRSIQSVVRNVLSGPHVSERPSVMAARLVTEVAKLTDFLSSPLEVGGRREYDDLTITIDLDNYRVCMNCPVGIDIPDYYALVGNTLYVDFYAAAKWGV